MTERGSPGERIAAAASIPWMIQMVWFGRVHGLHSGARRMACTAPPWNKRPEPKGRASGPGRGHYMKLSRWPTETVPLVGSYCSIVQIEFL